jgi:Domain of unknown function (DUF932)
MLRYSSSSKQTVYRGTEPLSNDVIARYAPSVLAESAHESRGERYSFIPTIQVIDGLRAEGFEPYEVRQTRVRDESKREHTKHLVRLRHASALASKDEVPEIILLNSHDGSSSYRLFSGVFRFICSNGLIAGDVIDDVRVRHSGNIVDDVIEGSYRVLETSNQIAERIGGYKAISLSEPEQQLFANAALQLRWDGEAPVEADRVLRANRWDDRKSDLWTTFNRVQENLIKGGIAGRSSTGRQVRTRAVGGVTENVKLNRALWSLADGLAKIKSGEQLLAA